MLGAGSREVHSPARGALGSWFEGSRWSAQARLPPCSRRTTRAPLQAGGWGLLVTPHCSPTQRVWCFFQGVDVVKEKVAN